MSTLREIVCSLFATIKSNIYLCLISEDCAFSINGIEIDLKELEMYEKRLAAKRLQNHQHPIDQSVTNDSTELDDLDEYLDQLNSAASSTPQEASNVQEHVVGFDDTESEHQTSLPLLLYGVMSIIFVLSTACRPSAN